MAFKFFGIGSAENKDRIGEWTDIAQMNVDSLRLVTDEHSMEGNDGKSGAWNIVGSVTFHQKIMKREDCKTPRQLKCWEIAQVPFLYVECELINEHPNAQAAEALIKYCALNPDLPLQVGLSIEGLVLRRGSENKEDPEYKHLVNTIAEGVAVTVRPCNPKCRLFPMNDLLKSDFNIQMPDKLLKSIMEAPEAATSFRNRPELVLERKIRDLRKSIDDVKRGGVTSVKCWACDHSDRMFKSSIANRCSKCNSAFSMNDIWEAINR